MRIQRLLIILSFILCHSEAQEIPYYEYKFRNEIKSELESGQLRNVFASYYYTYIGDYRRAMNIPGIEILLRWGFDTLNRENALHLKKFKLVEATKFLVEKAKNEQIVLINESHHNPQHRVFTRTLLKGFYDNGFRYFGLEALTFNHFDTTSAYHLLDTSLMERGYPLNSPITGTYTREPQMANLVRAAIDLGFQLFAYDKIERGKREVNQARYIKEILDRDPSARILVHCGQYHLLEEPFEIQDSQLIPMGQYLKEMTGIDPFTIDQDILTERFTEKECPFFTAIEVESQSPSVLVNEAGAFFNGPKGFKKLDAMVYHPRTDWINGRPNWLLYVDNHPHSVLMDDIDFNCPCLVKAFSTKEEVERGVPIDIIETADKKGKPVLHLPKEDYFLQIINAEMQSKLKKISIK